MNGEPSRRRSKSARRSDAVVGFIIPFFFIALASYEQVTQGKIDKYILGALLVFGLGALGWRIDVLFEKYLEAKAASVRPQDRRYEEEENGT